MNLFRILYLSPTDTIRNIEEKTAIKIRCSIRCTDDRVAYYSNTRTIWVDPLSKADIAAIRFIYGEGLNPFSFTAKCSFQYPNLDPEMAQKIINQFPESSFAEIANFILLSYKVNNAKSLEEKSAVLGLLERPLHSKFSFIRFMAEELRSKL